MTPTTTTANPRSDVQCGTDEVPHVKKPPRMRAVLSMKNSKGFLGIGGVGGFGGGMGMGTGP